MIVDVGFLISRSTFTPQNLKLHPKRLTASLRTEPPAKQSQAEAGDRPMRIAECGIWIAENKSCETKPSPRRVGDRSFRDAISCVSGVSTGPAHSMQGDAKCCVSTGGAAIRNKANACAQTSAKSFAGNELRSSGGCCETKPTRPAGPMAGTAHPKRSAAPPARTRWTLSRQCANNESFWDGPQIYVDEVMS